MKKLFVEPTMDIKSFAAENIVTESAIATTVEEARNAAGGYVEVDVVNTLKFTF